MIPRWDASCWWWKGQEWPPRPTSVAMPPEFYTDLDLQLLAAVDHTARWEALIAGTREMIDRPGRLSEIGFDEPGKSGPLTGAGVRDCLIECTRMFDDLHVPEVAGWLREPTEFLSAHQRLLVDCAQQVQTALRGGDHDTTVAAITDAADSLRAAAEHLHNHRFQPFPAYAPGQPDYDVMIIAGAALGAEIHRNPLREQLNGAGGIAGSPDFNPYVAALHQLELVTHRRIYRLLYRFCEHLDINLDDPPGLFAHPDQVDREAF